MAIKTYTNVINPCEAHIALVIDESGSISGLESEQIREGLRNFIDSQVYTENKISLIGMSDSDNNLRNDHILNNQITDSSICLLYTSRCV